MDTDFTIIDAERQLNLAIAERKRANQAVADARLALEKLQRDTREAVAQKRRDLKAQLAALTPKRIPRTGNGK